MSLKSPPPFLKISKKFRNSGEGGPNSGSVSCDVPLHRARSEAVRIHQIIYGIPIFNFSLIANFLVNIWISINPASSTGGGVYPDQNDEDFIHTDALAYTAPGAVNAGVLLKVSSSVKFDPPYLYPHDKLRVIFSTAQNHAAALPWAIAHYSEIDTGGETLRKVMEKKYSTLRPRVNQRG